MTPVRDLEYDVLSMLHSKLEALEAYDLYLEDCDEGDDDCRRLIEEIRNDDARHAERLRETLGRFLSVSGSRGK